MKPVFLFDGKVTADRTVLLAHGAGAPMDSGSMTALALSLASSGFRVARFEFDYMAVRRTSVGRKPPPRAERLVPEYIAAIEALHTRGPLFIGGKSMGGRVASMVADDLHGSGKIAGLLCLGYPFHPIGKPAQLRTAHLAGMKTPTLIVQGTRDPFGSQDEVAGYKLSKAIDILWLADGDHDFRPRKSVSGFVAADHLKTMAAQAAIWAEKIR
jgi:uncharacterized protein